MTLLNELWSSLRHGVVTLGAVIMFFGRMLAYTPAAFARFGLIVQQVYNAGALSLVIIMLCGLVRRHGARAAGFRPAAAFRLRRISRYRRGARPAQGAGTGRDRIAVLGTRRHRARFRDRPDARNGSAHSHGDDGGRSRATRVRAALSRWRDRHAAARRDLQRHRHLRRATRRRAAHGRGRRPILVADARERRSSTT